MPDTRRLLALLFTALAFGAAACGGDDNDSNPDGGGGQSDAPIVDDQPQGDNTEPDVPTPAPGEE